MWLIEKALIEKHGIKELVVFKHFALGRLQVRLSTLEIEPCTFCLGAEHHNHWTILSNCSLENNF